jgi:tetratricopeptide (TPR) repeat protein
MKWDIVASNEELAFLMEAGFIYRDSKKYQEARDVFSGIRALAPQSDVPEVALGTVAFQEADFAKAAKHYQKALELNPKSAYAYAHLGEACLFQKDKDAARQNLKKAIELDPRGEHGKMARSLLDLTEAVEFK